MIFKKSSFFLMLLCLFLGTLYLTPKIEKHIGNKKAKIITKNCEAYSAALLAKYNTNKKIDIEKTAEELTDEFNQKYINPINKKKLAYAMNEKIKGACNIRYDKTVKALDVTGLDSNNSIIIRIIIKPPSYVRYDRD